MSRSIKCIVFISSALLTSSVCGLASAQETTASHETGTFLDRVEAEGYVQVYASFPHPSGGEESEVKLAEEIELGLRMEPLEWLGAEFGWLHEHEYEEEEGVHEPGPITAAFVVGPHEGAWWVKGGLQFLPFTMFDLAGVHAVHDKSIGPFETGAIVDPVSYEYGALQEKSVIFGTALGPFVGNIFGYYGDDERKSDSRFGYGGALGYKRSMNDEDEFNLNLSFIDDMGNVESYQEEVFGNEDQTEAGHGTPATHAEDRVPGWAFATHLVLGEVTMTGEYLTTQGRYGTDVLAFDGRGARPSAWSIEAGYGFKLYGRGGEVLLGYQGSSEAVGLALPASRYMGILNFDLWNEKLYGTFEWIRDEDYTSAHGGTGTSENRYTFLMRFEF